MTEAERAPRELWRACMNVVEIAADYPHLERDYPDLYRMIDGLRAEMSLLVGGHVPHKARETERR